MENVSFTKRSLYGGMENRNLRQRINSIVQRERENDCMKNRCMKDYKEKLKQIKKPDILLKLKEKEYFDISTNNRVKEIKRVKGKENKKFNLFEGI